MVFDGRSSVVGHKVVYIIIIESLRGVNTRHGLKLDLKPI